MRQVLRAPSKCWGSQQRSPLRQPRRRINRLGWQANLLSGSSRAFTSSPGRDHRARMAHMQALELESVRVRVWERVWVREQERVRERAWVREVAQELLAARVHRRAPIPAIPVPRMRRPSNACRLLVQQDLVAAWGPGLRPHTWPASPRKASRSCSPPLSSPPNSTSSFWRSKQLNNAGGANTPTIGRLGNSPLSPSPYRIISSTATSCGAVLRSRSIAAAILCPADNRQ